MGCPHLAYRESDQEQAFEEPRAYCAVADRFVQPMRADICNDRYSLQHTSECEIYLNAAESGTSRSAASQETDP